MNVSQRRAVSPIIATLLLIAITVAAGVIVYVFVTGLSGNLTKSGGNQVTEQISLDSYNFQSPTFLTMYLRNTGTSAQTIS
ncbi:MAG: type IV pilin, partial [Nitrososphaerota archaeon]|nr:type IV pilin [Nitrososphaerota archaeon]